MDKDVIYRQDAIDAMWKIRRQLQMLDDAHKADRVMHGIYLAKKALERLPSAPERKTGKWLSHYEYCKKHKLLPSGLVAFWWCDQCEQGVEHPTNFCPNCGADMREGQDEYSN